MPKKRTHDEFIKLVLIKNPDIEIIGKYVNSKTRIKCKCKIDGHIWDAFPENILKGQKCPVCQNKKVVKGINDIATTNPEFLKYFCDITDAYKYTVKSGKTINFKCPKCGTVKKMRIYNLYYNGFTCPKCSDGISYPNKFSRSFLEQLPITNVKYEFRPTWAKQYFYDNYFEYNNTKYILEMDGSFHYKDIKFSSTSHSDLEKVQFKDSEKDFLAKQNNIVVIRIDSRNSNKDYIKDNIYKSLLSQIFDLSIIDWDLCDLQARNSLLFSVCNDYEQNECQDTFKLAEKYSLDRTTVQRYLRTGYHLGFCLYSPTPHKKKEVIVKDIENNILYSFNGVGECCRELSEMYDEHFPVTSVIRHCDNKTPYKNFIFERKGLDV